jgi:hypothetical protein
VSYISKAENFSILGSNQPSFPADVGMPAKKANTEFDALVWE